MGISFVNGPQNESGDFLMGHGFLNESVVIFIFYIKIDVISFKIRHVIILLGM